jgi:hypothetical protein
MARLERRNYGRGHGYKLDGRKVPSVTGILKAKAKDALVNWAAEETAKAAINRWDELAGMDPIDRYNTLKGARYDVNRAATMRGNEIHLYGAQLAEGKQPDVPVEFLAPVEGYARFLDEWAIDPETVVTEAPCCNTVHRYAGTLDSIAFIGRLGTWAVLDLKSGRGVYNETALQLVGYARCDLWQPKGVKAAKAGEPDSEVPLPDIDTSVSYVAHIGPDSTELLPVETGETEWNQFLYTKAIAAWDKAVEDDPPIGAALRPEDYPMPEATSE